MSSGCPNETAWLAFAAGSPAGSARGAMEVHLDQCAACRQLVTHLGALDLFASAGPSAASPSAPEAPGDDESLAPGDALGRYLILEPLGRGGWGSVYTAYDSQLHRRIALKVSRTAPQSAEAAAANELLLREAQSIAQLRHPGVVSLYDVGNAEGRVFLAMELMEGGSLARWLRAGPRPWREVLELFLLAGAGLQAAHDVGLVHRDFKPENVLMDGAGRACLTDFGLARSLGVLSGVGAARNASAWAGTPFYMAPELMTGARATPQSDQFSFAVALFEALTGTRPFEASSLSELHARLREGVPRARIRSLPTPVRTSVARALSFSPEARFGSVAQLLRALRFAANARRRRLAWAAGLALGGALVAVGIQRVNTERGCERTGAQLEPLWNPAKEAKVAARFRGSGLDFAARALWQTRTQLGAFKDAWSQLARGTCQSVHNGQLDPAAAEARQACLQDQRARFGAVVRLLEQADPALIERAPMLATALPRPQECRDVGSVSVGRQELREHAATAWGLAAAYRFKEMVVPLEQLADGLKRTPSPVLQGELHLLRGQSEAEQGALELARRDFEEAILLGQASSQDLLVAKASIEQFHVVGERMGRTEEGRQLFRRAEAAVARLRDPGLRATLYQRWGSFHVSAGDNAAAIAALQESVNQLTSARGRQTVEVAQALDRLGNAQREHGLYAPSRKSLEEARAVLEALLGPTHPEVASVLWNLGYLFRKEERYEESLALAGQAGKILAAAQGEDSVRFAKVLALMAGVKSQQGKADEAYALSRQALQIYEAKLDPDSPDIARALSNLSVFGDALLRFDEGEALRARALAIYERTRGKGSPIWQSVRVEDARALLARRQAKRGLECILEVRALQEQGGLSKVAPTYLRTLLLQGDLLREAGRASEAVAVLEQVREGILKTYGASGERYGDFLARRGVARAMLGDHRLAIADLEESLRLQPTLMVGSSYPAVARAALAFSLSKSGGRGDRVAQLTREARGELPRLPPVMAARIQAFLRL